MRKFAIAGIAALAIAGTTAVYAQHHQWFHDRMGHARMNPEDRAAMADAKIAAVHAGLKLSADQEKLWPPVESAVRDLVKIRLDRAAAREAMAAKPDDDQSQSDPVARLRKRAENMAASAAVLKKIADAADPLYKTLDDGQKRRLAMLTHHNRHGGGGGEGWRDRFQRGRFGGDRERGQDSERL
jgi:LTXXQ motif family protein